MMGENFANPWGRTNKKGSDIMMSSILNSGVFPGMQGGPLEHVIAAKAVAFGEALDPSFIEYGKQVIKNADAMAIELVKRDYNLVSGGTDNHLMLIDLRNKNTTGKEIEKALIQADITVNKNMVPFDDKTPFVTSGIRIGTPSITTRGFKEADCVKVVEWIDRVVSNPTDEASLLAIRGEVNSFMEAFPLYVDQKISNPV